MSLVQEIQKLTFTAVAGSDVLRIRKEDGSSPSATFTLDALDAGIGINLGLQQKVESLNDYDGYSVVFTGSLSESGGDWTGDLIATFSPAGNVPLLEIILSSDSSVITTATSEQEGNGDPEPNYHSCPEGYFYDPTVEACVPLGASPDVPATPAAPTIVVDGSVPKFTLTLPALPSGATMLHLRRSTDDGLTWNTVAAFDTGGGTWDDTGIAHGITYVYGLRACNAYGCSNWSDDSTAVNLNSPTCEVQWENPVLGDVISGRLRLRTRALDADQVYALIQGQQIFLTEGATNDTGTLWYGTLDTFGLRYSGTYTLQAFGLDEDGLSATETITVTIDNSLRNRTVWRDIHLKTGLTSGMVAKDQVAKKTAVHARLLPAANSLDARWWQFHVVSPEGADLDNDATDEELATDLRRFQNNVPLDTLFTLTGAKNGTSYATPDATIRCRRVGVPLEAPQRYATGCARIARLRLNGDKVDVFGVGQSSDDPDLVRRAAVFQLDPAADDPLTLVKDLSLTDYGDASDALVYNGKIYLVVPGNDNLVIYDLDPGEDTWEVKKPSESRPPLLLESLGGLPYVVHGDASGSTGYRVEFNTPKPMWTLPGQAILSAPFPDGTAALFAISKSDGTYALYKCTTSASSLVYSTPHRISAARAIASSLEDLGEDYAGANLYEIALVTAGGAKSIVRLTATGDDTESGSGFAEEIVALGEFTGAAPEMRGVAGGLSDALYRQNDLGAYAPFQDFDYASALTALQRQEIEIVPATGDELMDGDAAVTQEMLWIGTAMIADDADSEAEIIRYEQAPYTSSTAYLARAIDKVVLGVLPGPAPAE